MEQPLSMSATKQIGKSTHSISSMYDQNVNIESGACKNDKTGKRPS